MNRNKNKNNSPHYHLTFNVSQVHMNWLWRSSTFILTYSYNGQWTQENENNQIFFLSRRKKKIDSGTDNRTQMDKIKTRILVMMLIVFYPLEQPSRAVP